MEKEAIEIEKCPANFNRDNGWKISNAWKSIIQKIKRTQQSIQTVEIPSSISSNSKPSRNRRNKLKH